MLFLDLTRQSIGSATTFLARLVAFADHRWQRSTPELEIGKQFVVCNAIRSITSRIDEGIDHARRPGHDRSEDLHPWISILVVGNVHQHQRQETNEEAQKDGQHHTSQAGIFAIAR